MHSLKGKVAVPEGMVYNELHRIGEHEADSEEALARVGSLGRSLSKGSLGVLAHQGTSWHFVMAWALHPGELFRVQRGTPTIH